MCNENDFDTVMTKEGLTQTDYLYLLRRQSSIDTIDKIVERNESRLSSHQIGLLYGAADHRKVEIITGKLFDKVPKECWKLI